MTTHWQAETRHGTVMNGSSTLPPDQLLAVLTRSPLGLTDIEVTERPAQRKAS